MHDTVDEKYKGHVFCSLKEVVVAAAAATPASNVYAETNDNYSRPISTMVSHPHQNVIRPLAETETETDRQRQRDLEFEKFLQGL